ncbi:hypothetical protein KHQ81_00605 [Mycoplasmatota bacterium]|nr:hypothetical protein KHQ81_00605 [Mycoplasmatota bacterium]
MFIPYNSIHEIEVQNLIEIINENNIIFPYQCPNCKEIDTHIYFHKNNNSEIGGIWIWCGSCKHYLHGSIIPPTWWKNYSLITTEDLYAEPYKLDSVKNELDKHFNELYKMNF